MSVVMVMRVKADIGRVEQMAKDEPETFQAVSDRAKQVGCLHHQFFAGDGEVVVIDEWESPEAFQGFFESDPDIPGAMQRAGVQSEPEISILRKLDVGDDF